MNNTIDMKDIVETIEIVFPLEIQPLQEPVGESSFKRTQRKYREAAHGLASVSLEADNLERQRIDETARREIELERRREHERILLQRQFLRD